MQPGDIEFVSEGTASVPPPLPRPRTRRVLLAVALLGGGLAWVLTRHASAKPVAAPTSSQTQLPSAHVSQADLAAIEAAVKAELPTARLSEISTSVRADHGTSIGIAERILDAHIDSVDVLVRIRPYLRPEPAPTVGISPTPPGLGSAFFRFTTASFVVDVQWTGTDATPPPVDKLQALAADPRLESLS